MHVLGLMRVRNGGTDLSAALGSLARWCDDIYVVDDRSTDDTAQVLAAHPRVTNVVHSRRGLPGDPWLISETAGLELLYRMADFCRPDWIAMIDHDQVIETQVDLRGALAATPPDVAGLRCPIVSSWNDPQFPQMVPLMNGARGTRTPFWRYFPGLRASQKPLHNPHCPTNLKDRGRSAELEGVQVVHSGWDTLERRIAKVKLYQELDPANEFNFGAPYDRSLLFGYALQDIEQLKDDYRALAGANTQPGSAGL